MDDLTLLERQIDARKYELVSTAGEARSILLRGKALQEELVGLEEEVSDYERVTGLLNSLGEERQRSAQQTIESLVTRGLQTIFDPTLSFHIVQSVRGKSAVVEFLVRTTLPGLVVETPVLESRGGGLAATIGFLLRLVVMLLTKGTRAENVLVLDETFSMVSAEYLGPLSEFLREIVDKTGVQIILVTHQDELTENADVIYRFSTEVGQTKVKRVA